MRSDARPHLTLMDMSITPYWLVSLASAVDTSSERLYHFTFRVPVGDHTMGRWPAFER
jgi:hypothetical protein